MKLPEKLPNVSSELEKWKSMTFLELALEISSLFIDKEESKTFDY